MSLLGQATCGLVCVSIHGTFLSLAMSQYSLQSLCWDTSLRHGVLLL